MARKPTRLGKWSFKSRSDAWDFVRGALNEYALRQLIPEELVASVLRDLFRFHPHYEAKTRGLAVVNFFVDLRDYSTRCFYFTLEDGTVDHFSYKKCFANM